MNVKKLSNQELLETYEGINSFLNYTEQEIKKTEQSLDIDER